MQVDGGRKKKKKKKETNDSNVPFMVDLNVARSTNGTGVTSTANGSVAGLGPFPSFLDAFGSPNLSSLATKMRGIKIRMLEGKLVLLRDDGKPSKFSRQTQVEPLPQEEVVGLDLGTSHVEVPNSCVGEDEVVAGSSREVNKDSFMSPQEYVNDTINVEKEVLLPIKLAPVSFASLVTNEACNRKVNLDLLIQFSLVEGMNGVLRNGPWFIRSVPIILKKWTPNANLLKEDLCSRGQRLKHLNQLDVDGGLDAS
ncbi:ribonuclease H-like domain-containing protein [Tanacetum coccineum]